MGAVCLCPLRECAPRAPVYMFMDRPQTIAGVKKPPQGEDTRTDYDIPKPGCGPPRGPVGATRVRVFTASVRRRALCSRIASFKATRTLGEHAVAFVSAGDAYKDQNRHFCPVVTNHGGGQRGTGTSQGRNYRKEPLASSIFRVKKHRP